MVHKIMNIDDTYRSGSQLLEKEEMVTFENPAYNQSVEVKNSKLGVNKTLSSIRTSGLTYSGHNTQLSEKELLQLTPSLLETDS